MKISDFFSKIFKPIFYNKVVFDESKKRYTIYFGGKHIYIDGKIIDDIDKKEVISALKNSKEELFEKKKAIEFIREDQETDFDDLTKEFKKRRNLIKKIKPVLREEWRYCIELSFLYQKRIKRGQEELANKTRNQIRNIFGEKGNRLCNLFIYGYFDEFIVPKLNIIKRKYDRLEALDESDKFIERILNYFPLAIFVNIQKTEGIIIKDIKAKLIDNKADFIDLHAIGHKNICKVKAVIKKIKINPKFKNISYTSKEESIGDYKLVTYTLHKNKA